MFKGWAEKELAKDIVEEQPMGGEKVGECGTEDANWEVKKQKGAQPLDWWKHRTVIGFGAMKVIGNLDCLGFTGRNRGKPQ